MKDYWGNDALDSGNLVDLMNKYRDKLIVTVIDRPFGESCVLRLFEKGEDSQAHDFLVDYRAMMRSRGITAFGAGITLGTDLDSEQMQGFQGGAMI